MNIQVHAWPPYPGKGASGDSRIGGRVCPRAGRDEMKDRKLLTLLGLDTDPVIPGSSAGATRCFRSTAPGTWYTQPREDN
jgi:hypothetical protein